MELKRQLLKQNSLKGRVFTQITLDDDCIVKDNKPDVVKIIHTKGTVIFEEVKVSSQTVWVTGQLKFTVLYRSEGNRLETLSDSVNFGEKIFMDEVEELDTVKLSGKIEDLTISAINSRKLAVRAVLGMKAVCEEMLEEELVNAAMEEDGLLQKQEERQMLMLVMSKRDILRMHNELNLPGASPNIGKIIYYNADIRNKEVTMSADRIQIQAEAHLGVLYSSLEGQTEWYESMVPVAGTIDCQNASPQALSWICSEVADVELEAAADYDGEMRVMNLDMNFNVDIKIWKEEEVQILVDAYSLKRKLIPETEQMCTWKLMVKNEAKLRISQQLKLADEQERILQLCSYEGSVDVDQMELQENGLMVEGVLSVHILYATTDDNFPVAHAFEQIPFSQIIDVPGMELPADEVSYELDPGIDQLTVSLLDNERYEIKASLSLAALVLKRDCFDKIVDLREEAVDEKELVGMPGITGYIVQPGENLWDIAKHFHTTEDEIISTNGLKTPKIKENDKIIIVKSVC